MTVGDVREMNFTPGIYRHNATNSFYVALAVATCSTNGPGENLERSVIYFSLDRKTLRYREISEFLSPGRFTLIGTLEGGGTS